MAGLTIDRHPPPETTKGLQVSICLSAIRSFSILPKKD